MPKNKWTAVNIPPQAGRLAVVTGATSGIGYDAALALAGAGAQVVLAAPNGQKAQRAMASIRQVHPGTMLDFRYLDTAHLASVREFGTRWQDRLTSVRLWRHLDQFGQRKLEPNLANPIDGKAKPLGRTETDTEGFGPLKRGGIR